MLKIDDIKKLRDITGISLDAIRQALLKADGKIVAQTTDHNLAMKIGKALVHSYKGEHEYKFSKGEKFVEVIWARND